MAKWRLRTAHYLSVPGTTWEFKETDRETGRQNRMVLPVPLLLDPKDPVSCNRDGDCIVVRGKAGRGEFEFVGDPTPDMEPIDDEATAISATFEGRWQNPIDSLPSDFGASLIATLEKQMNEVIKTGQGAAPAVNASVSKDDFAKLQAQVAALMAQNAELKSKTEKRI